MAKENTKFKTREEWLENAVDFFRPRFAEAGRPLPDIIRVSIGFPSKGGTANRKRVVGQCLRETAAKDNIVQIYINPTTQEVGTADGILSILVHELIHATKIYGHGKEFRQMAVKLGLEGKMTATTATEALVEDFKILMERLGPLHHAALTPGSIGVGRKEATRMLKCICTTSGCDYTFRITRKWADTALPVCPVCGAQMKLDE